LIQFSYDEARLQEQPGAFAANVRCVRELKNNQTP